MTKLPRALQVTKPSASIQIVPTRAACRVRLLKSRFPTLSAWARTLSMNRKGVTLKDVAAAAKVSRATAARALNSYGYVGDETSARVLQIADSLGYRANRVAQALRRGQLPLIGFLPGDIQNPFFARIAHDLAVELRKQGHNLLIASSEESVEQERELLESLRSLSVRGFVLAPTSATDNQHVVKL